MTDRQDDLTSAALRARIAAASGSPGLRGSAVPGRVGLRGDHDFDPLLRPEGPLVAAAVLVPVIEAREGLRVLLTRRTAHLQAHAGQISFPGGRFETEDADAAACALREAEEEIGLDRGRVARSLKPHQAFAQRRGVHLRFAAKELVQRESAEIAHAMLPAKSATRRSAARTATMPVSPSSSTGARYAVHPSAA